MYDDNERIDFKYRDEDFNPEGKLNFELLPEYKARYDDEGYLINIEDKKRYFEAKAKNDTLRKFTRYHLSEALWENFERLSPLQQKALTLLVSGQNINQVASECNIERSTIYRWLQLEIFVTTFKLWQKELMIEADIKFKSLLDKALNRLEYVLDNPTKFDSRDYLKAIELCINFTKGDY